MTLKELSQLYYLNREIETLKRQLAEIECYAEGITQSFSGMPHGGSTSDKVGAGAVRIADLKSKIENRQIACWQEYCKLNDYISNIDDSFIRQIMSYRFINGLSWQQVADCIGGGNTADSVKKVCYRHLEKSS